MPDDVTAHHRRHPHPRMEHLRENMDNNLDSEPAPLLHNAGLSTKCGYRVEESPVFSALSPPQPLFIHRADTRCENVRGGWFLVTSKQAVARTAVRTGHQLDADEQPRR